MNPHVHTVKRQAPKRVSFCRLPRGSAPARIAPRLSEALQRHGRLFFDDARSRAGSREGAAPMYESMFAETVRITGDQGDTIDAYAARPFGGGPYPAVVVLHHM